LWWFREWRRISSKGLRLVRAIAILAMIPFTDRTPVALLESDTAGGQPIRITRTGAAQNQPIAFDLAAESDPLPAPFAQDALGAVAWQVLGLEVHDDRLPRHELLIGKSLVSLAQGIFTVEVRKVS
jgi:hypothetical protein